MRNNIENNTENNMKDNMKEDKELKPRKCGIGSGNLKILYKNLNKYFLMYREAYCKEMNKEKVTNDEIYTSIAAKVGVKPYSVGRWEDNYCPPSLDSIILLAKLFNCTVDDLLTEKPTDAENSSTLQSEDLSVEETQVNESEEKVVVKTDPTELEVKAEAEEVEAQAESTECEILNKKANVERDLLQVLNNMIEDSNLFLSKLNSNSAEILKEFRLFNDEDLEKYCHVIETFEKAYMLYIRNIHLSGTHYDYSKSKYKPKKEMLLRTSKTVYNKFIKRLPNRTRELIEKENESIDDAYNFYISVYMISRTLECYNKYKKSEN